jgi:hypothetical protein
LLERGEDCSSSRFSHLQGTCGEPGLIAQQSGVTVSVYAFEVAVDRISRIWAVRNPEKLRPWTTG